MPEIPTKIELHVADAKRALANNSLKAAVEAMLRGFEELDRAWPTLHQDLQKVEAP